MFFDVLCYLCFLMEENISKLVKLHFFWVLDDTFVDELRDLYYATLYVSEAHMLKNYIFNFVYPINILK